VVYVIGTGVDITLQRSAEAAFQASERRYKLLFHNYHTVMLLIDPLNGDIVDANPAACKFYGYTLEEIKAKKITEINTLPGFEVDAEMKKALDQSLNHFYFRHRLANGEEREVEVYSGPIELEGRSLLYSIIHDMTQRRQMENLVANLARFPNENPSPVLRVSRDGELLYANEASAPIRAVLNCQVGQFLSAEWLETISAVAASGSAQEIEIETQSQVFSCLLQPIAGEGYVNLYGRDITERERTRKALQSYANRLEVANRELQDFASIVSHDLQEPLRKIRTFGERLQSSLGSDLDEQASDYLARMIKASTRMQLMITNLLAYARVNTQGQPFTAVNLRQAANQALIDLDIRLEQTRGEVTIGELPVIEADPQQMIQLFQNLISNALKFHRPGHPPVVEVSGRIIPSRDPSTTGQVEVRVVDNGIGFQPEFAERIFQPFQRLHGRSEYEGTGIGLSICRKIVERHRGSIFAEGAPNSGSTFFVLLPVIQSQVDSPKSLF
jgi:PAS domain S-box-containing protein